VVVAFDTPLTWTKQIASHFGGTRQGMCVSWPKVIKDKGGIRNQFHHVIDIAPTLLEAKRIPAPNAVNGIPQKPMDGVSMMDDKDYQVPFRFTGNLHKLSLKIEPPVLTEADKQKLLQAHRNNSASQ
jgi:arylsulfatase A-like enzyme